MKDFIGKKLQESSLSTPSEYIRSLIRDDQDLKGRGDLAAILRRLQDENAPRGQDARIGVRRTRDSIAKSDNRPRCSSKRRDP
jgi:hypothetical protein